MINKVAAYIVGLINEDPNLNATIVNSYGVGVHVNGVGNYYQISDDGIITYVDVIDGYFGTMRQFLDIKDPKCFEKLAEHMPHFITALKRKLHVK